ncbi:MAG: hypothetical protein Q9160_008338 [Pyrenula sp. 1 TL-2023]
MATSTRSAIGMALAGKTGGVDIPNPRDGDNSDFHDSFVAVPNMPAPSKHGMLPTPPNSISPNLPPHPFQNTLVMPHSPRTVATHVDSDIDLQEAVDHAYSQDQSQHHPLNLEALDKLGDLNSAGAITSNMLAKHHLPQILLDHGPLAIRHVMGYLTTTVPGFSRIPPAKARRLVVGALEGKGNGFEGLGLSGDVEFEKVGWGRWDARIRGQTPRDRPAERSASVGPANSEPAGALHIPGQFFRRGEARSSPSDPSEFAALSQSDQGYHEADRMSLDGDDDRESCTSSEAPDEAMLDDLEGDVTEEEDWASIGAAALRARSFPSNPASGGGTLYQPIRSFSSIRSSPYAISRPIATTKVRKNSNKARKPSKSLLSYGVKASDTQEREAVEALLSLGSM